MKTKRGSKRPGHQLSGLHALLMLLACASAFQLHAASPFAALVPCRQGFACFFTRYPRLVLRPDAKKNNLQAASFGHLRNDPRAYSIQRFCGLSDSICVAPPSASAALIDSYGKIVLDRLCRGWSIYQFAKGYRFNGDDILLVHVAMAAMPSSNHLLELGSGTGSVSLMWLAQQESTAKVTLVEAQEASTKLCQQSAPKWHQ